MTDSTDFRELLLAYLLDELGSEERDRVDHRMLIDDEYSAALKEAEYDLLDSYAARELTAEQRSRVFKALIAPESNGVRSGVSAALRNDETEAGSAGKPVDGVGKTRPAPMLRWTWVGLAAAVLLSAGLAISFEYSVQHRRAAAIRSPRPNPAGPAVASGGATQSAAPAPLEPLAKPPARPVHPQLAAEALTLVLRETARGSLGLTARLPPQTEFLRVEWPGASSLPSDDSDSLSLQVADEQRVVITVPLAHEPKPAGGTAVFKVPVKELKPGSYLFRVVGTAGPEGPGTLPVYAENSITVTR